MRAAHIFAAAVTAASIAPALAAADPATTTCYAGTQTLTRGDTTKTLRVVSQRVVDPAKSQMVETGWDSESPATAKVVTHAIDAKTGTFTWLSNTGRKGSGALLGPAWHWIGETLQFQVESVAVTMVVVYDDKAEHTRFGAIKDGELYNSGIGELAVFDCGKLADQRAALAKK